MLCKYSTDDIYVTQQSQNNRFPYIIKDSEMNLDRLRNLRFLRTIRAFDSSETYVSMRLSVVKEIGLPLRFPKFVQTVSRDDMAASNRAMAVRRLLHWEGVSGLELPSFT